MKEQHPETEELTTWDGTPISLPEHIQALGPIPPAWTNVRFSRDPASDLYLVGTDEKGRVQYVYSPEHVEAAQAAKFARIRSCMDHVSDLRAYLRNIEHEDTRDCLVLIFETGLRPGSERETHADRNARGATTLRGDNVVKKDDGIYLEFTGKDGVFQSHRLYQKKLKENISRRAEKAGENGLLYSETSDAALRKALEPVGLHTKDLRTLLACRTAKHLLSRMEPASTAAAFARARSHVGDAVSSLLGNTRTIALTSYIDPLLFETWSPAGAQLWQEQRQQRAAKKTAKAVSAFEEKTAQQLVKEANTALRDHLQRPVSYTDAEASRHDAHHGYFDNASMFLSQGVPLGK